MTEVWVCKDWFPNKKRPEWSGFRMEEALKNNLDIIAKNIVKDWDFTILVTGGGEVRVGKSVLAQQIACYLVYLMRSKYKKEVCFNLERNFVFTGDNLITKGHWLGKNYPYSPLIFDEAGADLEGRKVTSNATKKVLDFFRECGQYNLFNILVIPEYFDLPKGIALSRSIFLIDVTYNADKEGNFKRGMFRFFSRKKKKRLYLLGKRELNYNASRYEFHGKFPNFYVINEEKYRDLKQIALIKRKETEEAKYDKKQERFDTAIYILWKTLGLTHMKISELFTEYGVNLPRTTITEALKRVSPKEMEVLDV